jgi:hypothetical protein
VRLGAGPSSATLVNLHIVRRVALSQANIWSRKRWTGPALNSHQCLLRTYGPAPATAAGRLSTGSLAVSKSRFKPRNRFSKSS